MGARIGSSRLPMTLSWGVHGRTLPRGVCWPLLTCTHTHDVLCSLSVRDALPPPHPLWGCHGGAPCTTFHACTTCCACTAGTASFVLALPLRSHPTGTAALMVAPSAQPRLCLHHRQAALLLASATRLFQCVRPRTRHAQTSRCARSYTLARTASHAPPPSTHGSRHLRVWWPPFSYVPRSRAAGCSCAPAARAIGVCAMPYTARPLSLSGCIDASSAVAGVAVRLRTVPALSVALTAAERMR
jgi:hypothetical protein